VFIDSGCNASVLERGLRGKPVKEYPIPVGALDKLSDDLAAIRELIHLDVDGTLH